MSTGTIAPQFWFQALDDTGVAVPGALVNFYASGTTTRIPAYADGNLTVPLANPQACNAAGRLVMYFSPTSYRIVVTTALGVEIMTVDPVGSTAIGLASGIGDIFVFGGDASSPITDTAYPAGATFDKLHAGSAVWNVDVANLAAGFYNFDAMLMALGGATVTVGLMNLSDGAPDTPLGEASSTSASGERVRSGALTLAFSGAPKSYGIKVHVDAGADHVGFVWGVRLVRIA